MIGPAELREIDEALNEERRECARPERRSPYLTPHVAMGMALTRAVAGELKRISLPYKR